MADDQFPPDIIYAILSRLPIKSLARFRCVCKSWLEYINDPYLETIHVEEQPTPIKFQPHLYENKEYCKISFLCVTQGTVKIKKDPVLQFCCMDWYPNKLVLGSCKGLTLVCYYQNDPYFSGTFLALINPLTKQHYNLPPVKIKYDGVNRFYQANGAGIGFDDSTNTLKTVCVILRGTYPTEINCARERLCTMVHDSGTSSWREVAQVPAYPIHGEGVFAHGRLHWHVGFHWWSPEDGTKVVWFDVKMEDFGLIDAPKREGGYSIHSQLVDLNGELGYTYLDFQNRMKLWMLKRDEWVLGCWNKEGDILLTLNGGKRSLVYTLKTGDLRAVGRGDPCEANIRITEATCFRSVLIG